MFKLATKTELRQINNSHRFFGRIGNLGVSYDKVQTLYGEIEPANALYILNKKYGLPNSGAIDDYKMTFEYVFRSNKFPAVYYTIYDYKGYMSCGFGVPLNMKISKKTGEILNSELQKLLIEAFAPINHYDYLLTVEGLKEE